MEAVELWVARMGEPVPEPVVLGLVARDGTRMHITMTQEEALQLAYDIRQRVHDA